MTVWREYWAFQLFSHSQHQVIHEIAVRRPQKLVGGMMRWRKITLNPKRRNYGNSTQILRRLAWFWSTFLFSKGPRRNVSSFLMFLPVRSFVLPGPCYPAVVSLGTLMGLNARQSEIFKEFKYLSLTRMKPFCTCVKLLHGGRTENGELSKCPIILVTF